MKPTRTALSLLAMLLFPLLLLADDPICGKWRFFNGSERMMNADGSSSAMGMAPDSRWQCMTPQARPGTDRSYNIANNSGRVIDRLTLRNAGTELWGMNRKGPFLSATRRAFSPGPKPMRQTPVPPAPMPTPAPAGNALEIIVTGHEWLWSEPGSASGRSGTLRFIAGGKVEHPWSNLPEWQWQRLGDSIAIGPASVEVAKRLLLSFNVERSEFRGTLPNGQGQVRGVRSDLINGPKPGPNVPPGQSAVPPQMAAGSGPLTTGYGGMTLGNDWMPRSTNVKRNELQDLAFYASYAVGAMAPGKEPIPVFIVPPLRWLMPLDEATKALGDVDPMPMKAFQNDGFPHNSLIIRCFQKRYFGDLDGQFNLVYLIADAKQRLVSVQFKSQAKVFPVLLPGTLEALRATHPPWGPPVAPPPQDGVRDHSYYDFINEGRSSNGLVGYQLRQSADKSVLLIRLDQKVHWYVPAPFARCLWDIGEHYRKAGLIK
jgi:hypothetical protein